jgi:hypothetical protein
MEGIISPTYKKRKEPFFKVTLFQLKESCVFAVHQIKNHTAYNYTVTWKNILGNYYLLINLTQSMNENLTNEKKLLSDLQRFPRNNDD